MTFLDVTKNRKISNDDRKEAFEIMQGYLASEGFPPPKFLKQKEVDELILRIEKGQEAIRSEMQDAITNKFK